MLSRLPTCRLCHVWPNASLLKSLIGARLTLAIQPRLYAGLTESLEMMYSIVRCLLKWCRMHCHDSQVTRLDDFTREASRVSPRTTKSPQSLSFRPVIIHHFMSKIPEFMLEKFWNFGVHKRPEIPEFPNSGTVITIFHWPLHWLKTSFILGLSQNYYESDEHISAVSKLCLYHISDHRHIRSTMDKNTKATSTLLLLLLFFLNLTNAILFC
jgi:hypothetical protein